MSDIGLDLLLSPGILERLCKAEGEVGVRRPSGTGNLGNGWGIPGIMIPGGRNGFEDKSMAEGELAAALEVSGCLSRPNGGGGKPGGRACIALLNKFGVLLDGGGGGDDLGEDVGLPLEFEVAVTIDVVAVVVMAVETTRLRGGEPAGGISSLGTGSLSIAAKLLLSSWGDACRFK